MRYQVIYNLSRGVHASSWHSNRSEALEVYETDAAAVIVFAVSGPDERVKIRG